MLQYCSLVFAQETYIIACPGGRKKWTELKRHILAKVDLKLYFNIWH